MEETFSKAKDVKFLAIELEKRIGEFISINRFALGQEVLTGKIILDKSQSARLNGIDFNIKYSKGEFLRINIGEINLISSYIKKEEAANLLVDTISQINLENNEYIGNPDAFYQIDNGGFYIPYYDWAWKNKEEYLRELKDNTMFDDADVENLIIFDKQAEKTLQKTKVHN